MSRSDVALLGGVDGCPAGWLCVWTDAERSRVESRVLRSTGELFEHARDFAVLAIDVPIGLSATGDRECDTLARRLLGARRSSVFPVPARAVLDAETYDDACATSARACGRKISRQTFAILPKIREVDALLRRDPALCTRVREAHPELCFTRWNAGTPMTHAKHTGFGFLERYRLVERVYGTAADAVRRAHARTEVGDDDVLDAFAALWTAERIHRGDAVRIGGAADAEGLPMEMWS